MQVIFHLGYSEELARLELETVLGQKVKKIASRQYQGQFDDFNQLNSVAHRLGGLVAIYDSESDKLLWRHKAKDWYRRDRLKPFANARLGLLPPKIARILVNLAVGPDLDADKILLDPFCGSGTILLEAALLGLKVIGSDINLDQLRGAAKNLAYFKAKDLGFIHADATHISDYLNPDQKVDYIVSEPFMGRPDLTDKNIKNVVLGLKKLYLGALKDWLKILKKGGKVVILMPQITLNDKTYTTSTVIDDSALFNYNITSTNLLYSRPNAILKRQIIILTKT